MSLSEQKLLHSYLLLHHIFPEDMHIARPLIQMLQKTDRNKEARNFALSMARRMMASGKAGFALGFLAICKQLNHPKTEEIEALSNMARITTSGTQESDSGSNHLFALIDQLSDQEALEFIAQASLIQAEPNQDIVTQGESSETFYLILEGAVDVRLMLADGEYKKITTLKAGDFFGEMGRLSDEPERSDWIRARGDCEVAEISYERFRQLANENPEILFQLASQMALRLRRTSGMVTRLAFMDVSGRIARTLLDLCKEPDAITHPAACRSRSHGRNRGASAGPPGEGSAR